MLTNSVVIGHGWPRPLRALVAACLAMVVLAACADSGGLPSGPDAQTTVPVATSPAPSASQDASTSWKSDFDAVQLKTYEQALARWVEYSRKSVAIYRAGRDTPQAREVFREYDLQAVARIRSLAETYEAQGLRIVRGPIPLGTQAISVEKTFVRISQCNDYSRLLVTRNGKPASDLRPKNIVTPLLIEMDRPTGSDWMVARVQLKDRSSCTA